MRLVISFVLMAACCLGSFHAASSAPVRSERDYYETRGEIVWEVPTQEKVIALTFDDGPDPVDTPAILDLLNEYEAKATFFLIGKHVAKYPEIAKREVISGHEIANHTYSHRYFNRNVAVEKIQDEMAQAEEAIYNSTGQRTHLFRPPGGYYNDIVVKASKKSGYQVVMWSWHQDTEDWNTPGVHKIVNKVLKNARNGDIVLFHDHVEGKSQTVEALKQILPELKNRGFKFITVSELLKYRKQFPL